jgi:probable HAF family extracellular repeat protein
MSMIVHPRVAVAAALCACALGAYADTKYAVTCLDCADVNLADMVNQINKKGIVAGNWGNGDDGSGQAAILDHGGHKLLGSLGGSRSVAYAINDWKQVVGIATLAGDATYHAFLWSNGVMSDLGTLSGSTDYSTAKGINNLNQVVGTSFVGSVQHGFIYQNGVMADMGPPGGLGDQYSAEAINDLGHVIGWIALSPNGDWGGYLYRDGEWINLGHLDESLPMSYPFAVNIHDQVVGWSDVRNADGQVTAHAFLWSGGVIKDLGVIPAGVDGYSTAFDINDEGQIVGSTTALTQPITAFLYKGGRMIDLNTLLAPGSAVWQLISAVSINNKGDIVGYGRIGFDTHALLLTPVR